MFSDFLTETLTKSSMRGGCGMSARPGFYSGRGATMSDLSSAKLETLFQAITTHVGKPAADAFVAMVAAMPSLSATDFLLTLARLESAGWKWSKDLLAAGHGVYADSEMSAFCTIVETLGGSRDRDDTLFIRGEFLRARGVKEPLAGARCDVFGFYERWAR